MGTLFDKARTAVLGKMHDLLDEVANTPSAYRQRIRDLEQALADLRAFKDEAVGTVNGYARDLLKCSSDKAEKQATIDMFLGDNDPSNDEFAPQLQMEIEDLDVQTATLTELQAASQTTVIELDKAVDQLEQKHREMVNGLNKLTLTAAATSAKNRASAAAEAAISATSATGDVDSIQARLDHDKDVADARFDRVFDGLKSSQSPEQAAKLARAQTALAARRAEIAAQASTQEPAPASA